ncbi:MAG TPA: MFS transporter [Pseudogracilibacillus sp.]|nr:MFS transporter [Pseudogracilibacillus sp.]
MDKRVYMLTAIAFVVGLSELIVGGILDLIADDLHIRVSAAGLLITVFAFVFGISSPILLVTFSKTERVNLAFGALIVFFIGSVIAVISPNYTVLFISRVISAASGSLATVLCINLASRIVAPQYRGRAIGLVVMGISGSLVLGLPVGVLLGNLFNWRVPFILVAILTIILLITMRVSLGRVEAGETIPLREQVRTLKDYRVLFAHLTTFFFLAGHFTLYGFLTPYVKTTMGFAGITISILYFIYGIAAVSGGGLTGMTSDRFGNRTTLLTVSALLVVCLFVIPYAVKIVPIFWVVLVIWGVMSWGITPPVQSHLYEVAQATADIQQSLNNAALQLGIAFGTLFGSFIIEVGTIEQTPHYGIILVILSLVSAMIATRTERSGRQYADTTL